ncbi:unnamed protein product [Phytomonas sp. Hart1]|nr:unnamed protein product [Phytomonas sp. Hart1]|eukprot:CCW71425.1 unnamed protein product [Phytomonas sp. isolate Hart1]
MPFKYSVLIFPHLFYFLHILCCLCCDLSRWSTTPLALINGKSVQLRYFRIFSINILLILI